VFEINHNIQELSYSIQV